MTFITFFVNAMENTTISNKKISHRHDAILTLGTQALAVGM